MNELYPKISVITPSYNQGRFIEQTILSVISQNYPNLEYIIMDGGSTDETIEIIKKYQKYIFHWQSKKDDGQAAAINQGFKLAHGEILCWINSDDLYKTGALEKIASLFELNNQPQLVFGNCIRFKEASKQSKGSDVIKSHHFHKLSLCDYIIQPSSFWNRAAWE